MKEREISELRVQEGRSINNDCTHFIAIPFIFLFYSDWTNSLMRFLNCIMDGFRVCIDGVRFLTYRGWVQAWVVLIATDRRRLDHNEKRHGGSISF